MQKAQFDFIHNRKKTSNLIELRIYFDRNTRKLISTGIYIDAKYWNDKKQIVGGGYPGADNINMYLQQMKAQYEQVEYDCILHNVAFTKEYLDSYISGRATRNSFADFCRNQLDKECATMSIAEGTQKMYRSIFNMLERFERETNYSLTCATFNAQALFNLDVWIKKQYAPETARKKITYIKKYVDLAVKLKMIKQNPFADYKFARIKTEKKRDALTMTDIEKLETLAESGTLDATSQVVCDRFLLSCYCGLRISDNSDLRKTDIGKDANGCMIIDRNTIKQGTRVTLPLEKLFDGKPAQIIKKYLISYPADSFVFPHLSDQKTNIKLKYISALAGIANSDISFHTARHTCATIIAEKTGNPFTVMQILGHTDIKISLVYIHNSYRAVCNSLDNIKW